MYRTGNPLFHPIQPPLRSAGPFFFDRPGSPVRRFFIFSFSRDFSGCESSILSIGIERISINKDSSIYLNLATRKISTPNFGAGFIRSRFRCFIKSSGHRIPNGVCLAQSLVALGCWTAFGAAVARAMRRRWMGPVAFMSILTLSSLRLIAMWDWHIYSESLSLSLMVFFIALWFYRSYPWGKGIVAGILVTAFFFGSTRETNAWLLTIVGLFIGGLWLIRRISWRYLVFPLFFFLFFMMNHVTMRISERWKTPFLDKWLHGFFPIRKSGSGLFGMGCR